MLGICCHGFVIFKKEVSICQLLVLGGALSIQALRQLTPLPSPKTGIEELVQCHFLGCSIAQVGVVELLLVT